MIRVRVELLRGGVGEPEELARMYIINDGSHAGPKRGSYNVEVLRGRGATAFLRRTIQKRGRVEEYPRLRYHVWHLVALALFRLEYGVLR